MKKDCQRTRGDLMEAYLILKHQGDDKSITVQQVLDKAGYSRHTFYRYFNSIDDLAVQCAHSSNMRAFYGESNMVSTLENVDSPTLKKLMISFYKDHTDAFELFFGENASKEMQSLAAEHFMNNLLDSYRGTNPTVLRQSKLIAVCNIQGVVGALAYWFQNLRDEMSIQEAIDIIVSVESKGALHLFKEVREAAGLPFGRNLE